MVAQKSSDQPLAASQSVDIGGVEKADAAVGRGPERREHRIFRDVAPLGSAELPAAQADFRHLGTIAAECSVIHRDIVCRAIMRQSNERYRKEKAKRERRLALRVAQEESGRECGGCTACCMVLGVAEVPTAFYTPCPHQGADCCTIYDRRPGACREFYCEWLVGALSEADRPDKLGLVFVGTRYVDSGKETAVVAA